MELNKETLKNERATRAWSQTQLADVSGLSLRTIQRIEKNGIASQESAKSLAAVYECSVTDLLTKSQSSKSGSKFSLRKTTSTAMVIHILFLVPVLTVALFLFWSEHTSTDWVNVVRDSVFSSSISAQRLDKISFLILVLAVGIPCLVPGIIYDYINKQGPFSK